jgi:hypothetical protein
VAPERLATGHTPKKLALPALVIESVIRSGKDRVAYTFDVCSGQSPVPHTVGHSTGFAELDQLLDTRIADLELALPTTPGTCTTLTLVLGRFEMACETRKTL